MPLFSYRSMRSGRPHAAKEAEESSWLETLAALRAMGVGIFSVLSLAWAWAKPEDNWSLLGRKDIGERVLSVGANLSVDVKVDGTKV